MVPDSLRESQETKGCVCWLDFAMSFSLGNKICKMLSAAVSFNKSPFEGVVK